MTGLFGTFNISKRGLNVSQANINVTAHNISNASTDGYSRQRTNVVASRAQTVIGSAGQVGTGAEVETISRIRDTFIDYQYRNENSALARNQVRSNFLYEVESVFNEPSDTGLSTMMGSFFDAFQELSKYANSSNTRTVAIQKASTLADAINSTYKNISALKVDAQSELQSNVKTINTYLDQINALNKQIRQISVQGQEPNDLLDKRDSLIDKLSAQFNLKVTNDDYNGLSISPEDTSGMVYPNMINSDPNNEGARLSYIKSIENNNDGTYKVTYYRYGDSTDAKNTTSVNVKMTEKEAKSLEANRVIWADGKGQLVGADGYPIRDGATIEFKELKTFTPEKGEIAGNISIQADVDNYIQQLNQMARSLAYSVNAIHSGSKDASTDEQPLFVNKDYAHYDEQSALKSEYWTTLNGDGVNLAESQIDASNISVNKELIKDPMKLNASTIIKDENVPNPGTSDENSGEGDGKRALAIAQIRNTLLNIQLCNEYTSRGQLVTNFTDDKNLNIESNSSGMTIIDYYKDIIDKLGVQAQEANRLTDNQKSMVKEYENSRAGVSGVSIDEEMTSLIAAQHAYAANAKVVSTVDELLDVVINGLKR
ncbi:MAG: flagellar hook-associated protein FlgK [Clostridiales bacterium]|nr:flagellar hook-associated protein FlgK [Clostridiales bacterium]